MKNRELISKMRKRGWSATITGKSHLKFEYEKTGAIVFHGGTPGDVRSEKNLMARVMRIEAEAEEKEEAAP